MNNIIYFGLNIIVTGIIVKYLIESHPCTHKLTIKNRVYSSLPNTFHSLVKNDVASKTYKTYTKFVLTTFDTPQINVYENEKKWLIRLYSSSYFPKLLYYDDDLRMLITTNIGTRVSAKHLSKINIPEQIDKILAELRKFNCRHNDIKPSEIVIKNNRLNLVDFGWAHEYDQPNPDYWPTCLGDIFKCEPYDDEGSLKKSIEHIRLNSV